ncbi:hypothetical protein GALMADRAFT_147412 [Galerina marginata CBS 339.88]|uniref:Uncharacterized protein n=1 Tax=Galerina marginata (strain CBS 339.88) TaxID=685588 RepID=A0A067SGY9_GALM3|nr:hypothetical protein GALMADRAFT_147412 [Galerina marginata CBS 339.88]
MPPPGAHLSIDELIAALKWKLEDEDDESSTIEMGGPSDLKWYVSKTMLHLSIANDTSTNSVVLFTRASLTSTWSQRLGELKHITNLVAYRRNTVAGVNLLPAEILSKIFLQLQAEYSNKPCCMPSEEQDLTGANEWIKVTHVCQIWRRCAQNTKVLWSQIFLGPDLPSPASMATHFFHLSHPLAISLEEAYDQLSYAEDDQMHKFYNLLDKYPNRISALYLRGHFPEAAWRLLHKSLPNLVELDVSFKKRPIRYGYTANFLGGSPSSSLKKLSLEHYTWPGVTPPALTHLYLTNDLHMVGLADFFSMLASISSTLQTLYLKGAGPNVLISEEHDVATRKKLVMPVLKHFEILSSPFYDNPNALLHLYKLSLPNVHTIIWDSRWTAELRTYTTALERTTMIPADEYMASVTHLVGWAAQAKCYALQGKTLYFDPSEVTASALEMWIRLLPNLVMLAVPTYVMWVHMNGVIIRITSLTHIHIGQASDDFIALVCILEKPSPFLPHLKALTLYYKRRLDDYLPQVKQNFIRTGLEPLSDPLINNSMTRTRDHLRATYTLRFDAEATNGLFLSDPSL